MSFPITCTACHKTFTISDEIYGKKVSGRVVTIKCKSCGAGIRVDGLKGAGTSAPAPAPAAPAEPSEALWAVDYPDGEDREFTTAEVLAEIARGAVERATLVWREGMAEWLEVHQVPELQGELAKVEAKKKAAETAAAAAAAAKAAPVHKPRAPMPTVTGLAGLPVGGFKPRPAQPPAPAPAPPAELPKPRAQQPSAPELPKPRAQQPSAPELPRPRAQQPSAPELPKPRAQQPSAPELPKPRAQQPSAPGLPKPPPTPPPLAMPGPNAAAAPTPPPLLPPIVEPTPPLPASVAQAVSRPTPPAFPAATTNPLPTGGFQAGPAVVADANVEWPQPKSKAPLILGILAVLAVVGGGVFLLAGKQEPPPVSTPITPVPPTPALATAAPTPETTATAAAPAPAAAEGSETASGSDPVAAPPDPGATPGAGFAELFAAGARKAESKGATVAPSGRFDAAATKAPLAEAANQAQACKQSGGPTGKVTVVVTFDPNGKAAGATITEPPFAGTSTGACITSAMKRASIPAFSGLPGTVSKTFSIL